MESGQHVRGTHMSFSEDREEDHLQMDGTQSIITYWALVQLIVTPTT